MNHLLLKIGNKEIKSNTLFKSMRLVLDMKDTRRTGSGMEKVNSITRMVDTMMENGRKIKCMAGENFTMKVVN